MTIMQTLSSNQTDLTSLLCTTIFPHGPFKYYKHRPFLQYYNCGDKMGFQIVKVKSRTLRDRPLFHLDVRYIYRKQEVIFQDGTLLVNENRNGCKWHLQISEGLYHTMTRVSPCTKACVHQITDATEALYCKQLQNEFHAVNFFLSRFDRISKM